MLNITSSNDSTESPTGAPILPRFTKLSHVIRDRVAHRPPIKQDPLARQQAIENALSTALWHVRHGTGTDSIQAATGRAIRAASMLKQTVSEASIGGRA